MCVTGMIVTESRIKPNLRASFPSSNDGGIWLQRHRHDLRDQSLSHTSIERLRGISPEQRRYLGEDEIDQAGRRQSGCLSACRGLDMAHIKGRREEAWGEGGHLRKSDLKPPKGALLVSCWVAKRTQTAWIKPVLSSVPAHRLISSPLVLLRKAVPSHQVTPPSVS